MSAHASEAEAALRANDPVAALAALTAAVRAAPGDARLRVFLAQLLCVLGEWERAHTQLNVVADLDAGAIPMREMVGHAVRCELMRAKVFAGERAPMVFGQPEAWLALLIEALMREQRNEAALAADLSARAFEACPASAGTMDGQPFAWIADADSRLGPVLEAMINGRYYWIPFQRLARISLEAPTDLRDFVWIPAQLVFANGGEALAMIPVRYPGSERSTDGGLRLSRRTEWRDLGGERWAGLGQRVLLTDQGEHSLLDVRLIELQPSAAEGEAS